MSQRKYRAQLVRSSYVRCNKICDASFSQTKGADANTNSVYNLAYPNAGVLIADNGKVISLEHAGCDAGSTTFTGITLNVKCKLRNHTDC